MTDSADDDTTRSNPREYDSINLLRVEYLLQPIPSARIIPRLLQNHIIRGYVERRKDLSRRIFGSNISQTRNSGLERTIRANLWSFWSRKEDSGEDGERRRGLCVDRIDPCLDIRYEGVALGCVRYARDNSRDEVEVEDSEVFAEVESSVVEGDCRGDAAESWCGGRVLG